jgi:hypothetical protein
LEAVDCYDPPNLTFPFGTYVCVVDIDKGTGEVKMRRFVARFFPAVLAIRPMALASKSRIITMIPSQTLAVLHVDQGSSPNTATPFVVPTKTLPFTIIGVMNLLPAPN